MSFQQKNVTVTLVNFSLILAFFSIRMMQLISNDNFTQPHVVRVWAIVIFLSVIVTLLATILTHIVLAIIEIFRTGNENPEIESLVDERDNLIDLKGTKATYLITSIGSLVAMLTFAFGQPPLVMFSLLIFIGVFAQIVGDARRLQLYRRGY